MNERKKLRDKQTEAEVLPKEHFGFLNLPKIRIKRQHPILYFAADFYCHKAKLVIEVDGGYHNIPEQWQYNSERDAELENLGLKVIRFTNEQVFNETERVIQTIEQEIKARLPKDWY